MIVAATLLWSVEVVIAKRLLPHTTPLTIGVARLLGGSVLLVGWLAVSGKWSTFAGLDAHHWGWALMTGLILTGYVVTWFSALSRARAVDVTAILVFGAVITGVLNTVIRERALDGLIDGYLLITLGVVLAAAIGLTQPADRETAGSR